MAAEQRRAVVVEGGHVAVIDGVAVLIQSAGEKWHDLGGLEERVGVAFSAEGGLVAVFSADAAERAAAMRGIDGDVVRQSSEANLQGSKRLERKVHGKVRSEQVGTRDGAHHHGAP